MAARRWRLRVTGAANRRRPLAPMPAKTSNRAPAPPFLCGRDMRVLLTRPEPEAQRTAAALRARGHAVVVAPLLRIEILSDAELGDGPWAAILVTSANAVRAIAGHRRRHDLHGIPAFTVGRHSAQAMRDAGF